MRTFKWTWQTSYLNIKIYENDKLFGKINGFVDGKVSTINDKQFFIDSPKKMYRTFISDPKDNKAYCEIEYLNHPKYKYKSPLFEYLSDTAGIWPLNRQIFLLNNEQSKIELNIPRGFLTNEGTIKVYDDKNVELCIYILFHLNNMDDPDAGV